MIRQHASGCDRNRRRGRRRSTDRSGAPVPDGGFVEKKLSTLPSESGEEWSLTTR